MKKYRENRKRKKRKEREGKEHRKDNEKENTGGGGQENWTKTEKGERLEKEKIGNGAKTVTKRKKLKINK